jgi:hypothetical protein
MLRLSRARDDEAPVRIDSAPETERLNLSVGLHWPYNLPLALREVSAGSYHRVVGKAWRPGEDHGHPTGQAARVGPLG